MELLQPPVLPIRAASNVNPPEMKDLEAVVAVVLLVSAIRATTPNLAAVLMVFVPLRVLWAKDANQLKVRSSRSFTYLRNMFTSICYGRWLW